MERQWIIAEAQPDDGGIAWSGICDLPCVVNLLRRKGFTCAEEVQAFLQPRLRSLSDPFLLPNMAAAVERILQAVDAGERIVLFGDYDVDGVTSLALLSGMLRASGAEPALFLPLRMEEGYGLSRESVERCWELHQPQLLIAVDCGTSSVEEIAELKRRGADVIVLDHHEPPLRSGCTGEPKEALPDCVAVVNPKIASDCALRYLCSAGVVFKVCHALLKRRPLENFDLKAQLDLVALGTVADIVPLEGENRTLVYHGLRQLNRTSRVGVRKLMEAAGVRGPVCAEDIGYRLGPRLNAAGRLDTAEQALRLLITEDEHEAEELAALLEVQNRERQAVEKEIYAAAEEQVAANFDPGRDAALVVGARAWHPGVLGIVASRLMRKYHRPTIVVGFAAAGLGKGSGRSIEGFSLVAALGCCAEWLEKYGGHEMAAGLALREGNFARFAEAFRRCAREQLTEAALQAPLHLDEEVTLADLNGALLRWHDALEPFGNSNAQPLFFARQVEPAAPPETLKEKHLVLRLRQRNRQMRAIFFGGAEEPLPPPPWDVAFRVQADEYQGERRLQLQVQAVRAAAGGE
ncbi:MAG: single-stranded-DNA-specific exonuclease RecJ [Chthoniobacterales bacterium]|nr:single-stranded-DNA-specific exonuclease RecJ [Chthoniobacterales bacterium]